MKIAGRIATPYRLVKDLALFAFDTLFFLFGRSNAETDRLIIVKLDAIGDFVLWQSYADLVRRGFPNHHITLVANSQWNELAQSLSHWDETYAIDTRRFVRDLRYRKTVIEDITAIGADVVLHPTFSRHFSISDAVVRMTRARERIGFKGDTSNMHPILKPISDSFYTQLLGQENGVDSELHRSYFFMTKTCGPAVELVKPRLRPHIDVAVANLPDRFFMLFPGAGSAGRRWPVDYFAEIAKRTTATTGLVPVICGSGSEVELANSISKSLQTPVCNLADKTSLSQLIAIVQRAEFVVTNETSAVHIAAGVGTPVVCILGGGHFGRFLPYLVDTPDPYVATVSANLDCFGCNWVCKFRVKPASPKPCVEMIDVDSVWSAIQRLPRRPVL